MTGKARRRAAKGSCGGSHAPVFANVPLMALALVGGVVIPLWSVASEWEEQQRRESCPICGRGEPLDGLGELPESWVTGGEAAPLPRDRTKKKIANLDGASVRGHASAHAGGHQHWRSAQLAAVQPGC